jgi:hypothetical protein
VDDGSADSTAEVVESISDSRTTFIRAPHGGLVEAVRRGMQHASGELVARADGDDVYLPQLFEREIETLDEHTATVAVGAWARQFGALQTCWRTATDPEGIRRELRTGCALVQPAVVRRWAYEEAGGLPHAHWEDWHLWIRLAEQHDLRNVPEFLVLYRFRGGSLWRAAGRVRRRRANLQARLTAARALGLDRRSAFVLGRNLVSLPVYRVIDRFLPPLPPPPPTLDRPPSLSVVLLGDDDVDRVAALPGLDSVDEIVTEGESERDRLSAGTQAARSEVIAYLTADTVPGPDWSAEMKRAFLDPTVGIAGGPSSRDDRSADCYADVPSLTGSGVAFRRALVAQHSETAASLEELQASACAEAHRLGLRILFTRWATVEPAPSVSAAR